MTGGRYMTQERGVFDTEETADNLRTICPDQPPPVSPLIDRLDQASLESLAAFVRLKGWV